MSNNLWRSLFSTNYSLAEKWQLLKSYFVTFSDLDIPQPHNSNLLHLAAKSNDLELLKVVIDNNNSLIDVDLQDNNGWTALHIAAYYGNLDMIRYLVNKREADLEIKTFNDFEDTTAMHIGMRRAVYTLDTELTKYLVSKGGEFINPSLKTYKGKTSEDYLIELYIYYLANQKYGTKLLKVIEEYNAEVETANQEESISEHVFRKLQLYDEHNNSDIVNVNGDIG